jgi:hypothetical protein
MNREIVYSAVLISLVASRDAMAQVCHSNSCGAQTTISYSSGSDTLEVSNAGAGNAVTGTSGGSGSSGVGGWNTNGGNGVYGQSNYSQGSSDAVPAFGGVTGDNTSTESVGGPGVLGISANANGVYGIANGGGYLAGVKGLSAASGGGVGVGGWASPGTSNPSAGAYGTISPAGAGYGIWGQNASTAAGAYAGYFNGNVEVTSGYSYTYNGVCVAGFCTSDRRLKQNIQPLTGALDQLLQLKGVTYKWINPEDHGNQAGIQTGFIAQDVEKVFPSWGGESDAGTKGIALPPMQILALEVESFRTLNAKIDRQQIDIDELKGQVRALSDARRPVISMNANGAGIGVAGIALAGAFLVSRRKRLS